MLRIEREMEEVTVFYRPNIMHVEELSRNPVANALAVTFLMHSEQVRSTGLLNACRFQERSGRHSSHALNKEAQH